MIDAQRAAGPRTAPLAFLRSLDCEKVKALPDT